MPRNPRIITETINFLRDLADRLVNEDVGNVERISTEARVQDLRRMADKLDKYDARETRKAIPDPWQHPVFLLNPLTGDSRKT